MKKSTFASVILISLINAFSPSTSFADSWKLAMNYPDTGATVKKFFFNSDKNVYLLSSGQLFKSANQGKNWKTEQHFLWSNSIFTDNSNNLFANAKDATEKLELVKLSPTPSSKPMWQHLGFEAFIDALAITNDNKVMYAHIIENPTSATHENEIYRSEDSGQHWQPTGFNLTSNSDRWYGVSLALDSHNNLYAGNWNGLYKFSADSKSWQRLKTYNFNVLSLEGGIVVDKLDNIYVATHEGKIYKFINGSSSSSLIADLQKDNAIKGMIIDQQNNLYISTANDGIYKLAYGENALKHINNGLPSLLTDKFALDTKGNLYVTIPELNQIYRLNTLA